MKGAVGRLAQLAERLLYTQDVGGSIPSPPTTSPNAVPAKKKGACITPRCGEDKNISKIIKVAH